MLPDQSKHILKVLVDHLWQERVTQKGELEKVWVEELEAVDRLFEEGFVNVSSPNGGDSTAPHFVIPSLKGLLEVYPESARAVDLVVQRFREQYADDTSEIDLDDVRAAKVTFLSRKPGIVPPMIQFGEVNCICWALAHLKGVDLLDLRLRWSNRNECRIERVFLKAGILRAPRAETLLEIERQAETGKGSTATSVKQPVPDMKFIQDPKLRSIVARDWEEAFKSLASGAWKAAIVMMTDRPTMAA